MDQNSLNDPQRQMWMPGNFEKLTGMF